MVVKQPGLMNALMRLLTLSVRVTIIAKLIFTNNKSFKKIEVYEKVVKEATASLIARGREFPFTAQQVRTSLNHI